jgi:cobalt-zinc-cadmium efflux system outer membrane protein
LLRSVALVACRRSRIVVKPIIWLVAGVIAVDFVASTAVAQSGPASPSSASAVSLAGAVDAAWQRAVEASEAQGQRQRADAERVAADSLWAAPPALLFGYRDDRWQSNFGNREAEVALAWPLWLPGQREARGAAADSAIKLARLARQAARLRIAGEVREAAWTLIALQAELAQAEAQVSALRALADDVDRRVRAGDLARADALVARADLLSASARADEAGQRLLEARSQWAVLTGLDALPGAAEPAGAPAAGADLAAHPELRLATQAAELARRRVEVARVSRRDPPEIAVGLRQEVPGRGELTQNSIGIGLRLPFGTDDRNQPLQAAALSELDVALAREQRLRERLDAQAAAARAALHAAERQLADHRARSALLRERAQLIEKSFRAGESPLPELLRALDAAAQADAALVRQQAMAGLARERINQSLGLLP